MDARTRENGRYDAVIGPCTPNDDTFDIIANKACPPAVQINRPDDAEEMSLCRLLDRANAACHVLNRKRQE